MAEMLSRSDRVASASPRLADAWAGLREGLVIAAVSGPFALLFGALAVKNGLTTGEVVLMSATIYGGASQMVGIQLFGTGVAPWVIVLSIFAVNFRHVLYSAAVGRGLEHWTGVAKAVGFFFLVDPQYAEAERRAELGKPLSLSWYFAMAAPTYVLWVFNSALGAMFGNLIGDPHAIGIDFLLPIYFCGMVMDFRRRPRWLPIVAASSLASILAFRFIGSPWHVPVGAVAGIVLATVLRPVPAGQGVAR